MSVTGKINKQFGGGRALAAGSVLLRHGHNDLGSPGRADCPFPEPGPEETSSPGGKRILDVGTHSKHGL